MPAAVRSLPPPAKKRKVDAPSEVFQSVQKLEQQISDAAENNGSLNPIADLLELATTTKHAEDASKSIYALYRSFVTIIRKGKFTVAGDENAKLVKAWLWEQLNAYVELLAGLLQDEEKTLRVRTSLLVSIYALIKLFSGICPAGPHVAAEAPFNVILRTFIASLPSIPCISFSTDRECPFTVSTIIS